MKLPAARISAAPKTCQALLSKWAQTHLKERSPGAAAYRLIETPVAKSLIFQPYSLNISLWGAVLLCVELLRHGGQTTKQLSAVVKRLGNQQRNPPTPKKNERLRQPRPHFHTSQTHPFFTSSLSVLCAACMWTNHPPLKGVKVKTWQQKLSLTFHLLYNTWTRKTHS